jgi:hypothetical protein
MKHWDLSLRDCIDWWDTIDEGGANQAGVRSLCQLDRYYLLVRVMKREDMLHPWLYARCRDVERSPDNHIDLWGREHYKSTIITFGGVIQEILNDPEITVGIFSHSLGISSEFLKQIKNELENNETLKWAFPDILYSNPAKESPQWSISSGIVVKRKANPKEATVEASGVVEGQPIGKHYALRVYDDVVVPESVSTPEQIAKTTAGYSMSQSLGKIGGRKWIIGTRYNYADTYQWILDRGAAQPRIFAATADGKPDGDPVFFTANEWRLRRINNSDSDIACQYLQDPLSGKNRMFDVQDLQVYEIRPETLNVYIMCDPAKSKNVGSDSTAIAVVGVDMNMNKYLLDGFNHKMDLQERWQRFREMYIKWKRATGVRYVKMGYESFSAQADLDYFEERMKSEGPRFSIELLAWPREGGGSKIDRVQRLGPDMKQHKIFLPYPTDPDKLTKNQRLMIERGYDYRVSRSIKRKNEDGQTYDLSQHLETQTHFFPFGGKKDLIDVLSRIYDMDPRPPAIINESYCEPEFT